MSAKLSTHALDIAAGRPADGLRLRLSRLVPGQIPELLVEVETNLDGRTETPLLQGDAVTPGCYEIVFEVGRYFARGGGRTAPAFLDEVPVRFQVAESGMSYHVPLLFSPWAYSTYRGS